MTFDTSHDWHKWQTLYGFATINGSKRAYLTHGGGPEGGVVRLSRSITLDKTWYVWHRSWGRPANILRIPRELALIYGNGDGYKAIKLVMLDDYELLEDENYLDDLEDICGEDDDSE